MNESKNLMKEPIRILYEEILEVKVLICEFQRILKKANEDSTNRNEIGIALIHKMDNLKLSNLDVKLIHDRIWSYWMGNIDEKELARNLNMYYSQITEAESCFNLRELFADNACKKENS